MKRQIIAKLLVLCLVVSMLPAFALTGRAEGSASNDSYTDCTCSGSNDPYCTCGDDCDCGKTETIPPVDEEEEDSNSSSGTATPSETEESEVVEDFDEVETTTNAAGETVLTATVEVKDATASVEVSEKAVDALIAQAKAGEVVTIAAKTTGAVSVSAAKLAALVEKTGKAVNVGNSVAAAKVNSALLALAGGAELKIAPVKKANGAISIPVTAGGKVIRPEDVPGGIDVEIPTEYTADEVSGVNAIEADESEVALDWSISDGNLEVILTVTGDIEIVTKQ